MSQAHLVRPPALSRRAWTTARGERRAAWRFSLAVEDADGTVRRIRKSGFPTKADAQAAAATEAERIRRPPAVESPTLHRILAAYEADGLARMRPNSQRGEVDCLRALRRTLPDIPAAEASALEVERHIAARTAQGRRPATIRREVQTLKRAIAFGVRCRMLDAPPIPTMPTVRVPRTDPKVPDAATVRRLLHHADPELRLAVLLAATCGLRRGECLSARWGDLDADAATLTVACDSERLTKNGRARTVPVPPGTMRELLARRGDPDAPMLGGLTANALRLRWQKLKARLGIDRCAFHGLRHHYATEAARRGVPAAALQQVLGHGTLAMVSVYLRGRDLALEARDYAPDIATEAAQ